MGAPVWTPEEKEYFHNVIIPQTHYATGKYDSTNGKSFGELAVVMQNELDRRGLSKRNYTGQMLWMHYYQKHSPRSKERGDGDAHLFPPASSRPRSSSVIGGISAVSPSTLSAPLPLASPDSTAQLPPARQQQSGAKGDSATYAPVNNTTGSELFLGMSPGNEQIAQKVSATNPTSRKRPSLPCVNSIEDSDYDDKVDWKPTKARKREAFNPPASSTTKKRLTGRSKIIAPKRISAKTNTTNTSNPVNRTNIQDHLPAGSCTPRAFASMANSSPSGNTKKFSSSNTKPPYLQTVNKVFTFSIKIVEPTPEYMHTIGYESGAPATLPFQTNTQIQDFRRLPSAEQTQPVRDMDNAAVGQTRQRRNFGSLTSALDVRQSIEMDGIDVHDR